MQQNPGEEFDVVDPAVPGLIRQSERVAAPLAADSERLAR